MCIVFYTVNPVSTRSRPKAAGNLEKMTNPTISRFNTQPPEGGWASSNPINQQRS